MRESECKACIDALSPQARASVVPAQCRFQDPNTPVVRVPLRACTGKARWHEEDIQ